MTNAIAWLGTPPGGIPPLATTDRIEVFEWERRGWTVTELIDASPKGGSDSAVAEYIAARDAYEDATKPRGSFGHPKGLKHGDPIGIRYRNARAALGIASSYLNDDWSMKGTHDASPKGGNIPAPRIELTNGQIAQLADFAGTPVAGEPLDEQEVLVIQHADTGHSGPGLYAYYDELPEEGALYLDGQLPDSPPATARGCRNELGSCHMYEWLGHVRTTEGDFLPVRGCLLSRIG